MRLRTYQLVGLLALLPLGGCNSNANNANNAVAGDPHPAGNELDQALERRPKLENDKNRGERRKGEPKTWIGRAVIGVMGNSEGISADEQDKLRDYILANDEFLSQHMESPKELIRRANQRPEPMRVQGGSKSSPGKPGGAAKPPELNAPAPKPPLTPVPPPEKPAVAPPAAPSEADPFGAAP